MAIIKQEEIIAVDIDGSILCMDCFEGDLEELTFDQIITEDTIEDDDLIFCDNCNKQI